EGTDVPLWILGSSTDSAHLAAALGLPYVFASHFAPAQLMPALQIYRENFTPSDQLAEPYVMTCVNIVAAETDDQAEWLSTSMKQMFMGIVTGNRKPLQPPVDDMDAIWNLHEKTAIGQMLSCSFIGSKATIKKELTGFLEKTGSNEIMIASYLYDHQQRLKSHRLFAEMMNGDA
ncbi:MAG TPA: MsnO8 family LLM class oxidoreductase, partial [Balneolaceae bacterium]|nr:MsnO8 family LLM class oxidoreductase [Balneolaceae bacterium]